MKEQIFCPVCGYVTLENRLGKACPVCGVDRSVFKRFEDKISSKRRVRLDLHLHPQTVHFPQALSVMIFFLLLFSLSVNHPLKGTLQITVQVLMVLLPFSVLVGMFLGILDGITRFKRLKGIFLRVKLMLGVIFLISSMTLALFVLLNAQGELWIYLLFSGLCLICSLVLGYIGGKLACLSVNG